MAVKWGDVTLSFPERSNVVHVDYESDFVNVGPFILTFNSVKELDQAGAVIPNNKVENMEGQVFNYQDFPDSEVNGVKAHEVDFEVELEHAGEIVGHMKSEFFLIKEEGTVGPDLNSDTVERYDVVAGNVKFNLRFEQWQWSDEGRFIELSATLNSVSALSSVDDIANIVLPFGSRLVLTKAVATDDVLGEMAEGYPQVVVSSSDDKTAEFTFRFHRFENHVMYDPLICVAPPAGKCVNTVTTTTTTTEGDGGEGGDDVTDVTIEVDEVRVTFPLTGNTMEVTHTGLQGSAFTLTFDSVKELGQNGQVVNAIDDMEGQVFTYSQIPDTFVNEVQAQQVNFKVNLGGVGAFGTMQGEVFVIEGRGLVGQDLDDAAAERYVVSPGNIKFNVKLSEWQWSNGGEFVEMTLTLKGPIGFDNADDISNIDLTPNLPFNSWLVLTNQVSVGSDLATMVEGFPKVEVDSGDATKMKFTFRFAKFGDEVLMYDPLICLSPMDGTCLKFEGTESDLEDLFNDSSAGIASTLGALVLVLSRFA